MWENLLRREVWYGRSVYREIVEEIIIIIFFCLMYRVILVINEVFL